jgi:Rps23 Pro-64 3,4-dihydroxylase Tpa1-like proline 4-hydroxylase
MSDEFDPYIEALDVAALRESFHNAEPFPFMVIDNFLKEEFHRSILDAYPSAIEAEAIGETFTAVNESGKTQVTDSNTFAEPVAKLNQVLSSPAWLDTLGKITGIDELAADEALDGGGMHIMRAGAHLDVHVDFNVSLETRLHRRLNILVFLNDRWDDDWGGRLELWDKNVQQRHHALLPISNRCAVFRTSELSFHGVEKICCPEAFARRSFAAYYYTQKAAPGWNGKRHSTVFRARPEERLKRWILMPASKIAKLAHKVVRRLT